MLTAFAGAASVFAMATAEWASASLVSASVPASATRRRARLHGLERIHRDRQHLVLDLDQVERLLGDGQLVGGHRGDRLAHEDGAVDGEDGVGARLGAFFFRCGMSVAVSTARTPGSALRGADVDAT